MSDIKERLDRLKKTIQTVEFKEGKGLSNEVNIRIFKYSPKDEMTVRYFVEQTIKDDSIDCNLVECNLYHIFLEICEAMDVMDAIPEMEETEGSDFLLEQLQNLISNDDFVGSINNRITDAGFDAEDCVIMLTGIGEVYPYVRLHSILEMLQPNFSNVPLIAMYPGSFDGSYLRLFEKFDPNPYYRAFNEI